MTKIFGTLSIILLILFIFTAFKYRDYAHQSALTSLKAETTIVARGQANTLESALQKFTLLPLALSENPYVFDTLQNTTQQNLVELNKKLALLAEQTDAPYIFVIDKNGKTIASSNYDKEDNFIGRSYKFRPYFQSAITNGSAQYFAKGERTGKAGLFLARRIEESTKTLGVIVVKVEFENITDLWRAQSGISLVTNEEGIILFSSDDTLSYTTLRPLSEYRTKEIMDSMQFGDTPLQKSPLQLRDKAMGKDAFGRNIQATTLELPVLDWQMIRFELIEPALKAADARVGTALSSTFFLLCGMFVWLFWRINKERRRKETTNYLKTEVARQTEEISKANIKLENEIKERERINSRFRTAREDLAQANRLGSIGAITASVAHEINQPVAAIRAFAENTAKFLERGQPENANENISSIVELTGKIGTITAELRRYARRGSHTLGRISLQDIFEGIDLLMGDRLKAANIDFKIIGLDDTSSAVKAGRVRLEQVIVNIIQNAMEALEDNQNPHIEINIENEGDIVSVIIADNGDGVSEEIASQIFDPFFTQKPEGLGIGLGIAKDIMTEFGGTIELTKSHLGGAAFKLGLLKV